MKYKNKLKITRSLSFLLVMLMLLLQVPFSAVAEGDAVAPPTSDDVTLEGEAELFEFETISTVREVAEWREENVKHFTLPNGTYQAVTYADPVHRKDDAGVWQDIDNSLSLQSFKGVSLLANADMRTVFAPSFAANTPLFTLSENGYDISMSYLSTGSGLELTAIGAETTPAAVTNAPTRTKTEWDSIEEASTVDNKTSIVYSGVRTNTDLEYILQGNDIKENIIVKAPATSYVYRFELALVGLTAQMNEDGSISLRDATTGDAKYSIPAPYMVDANGERSNEVAYTLTALSTGGYRLTVTANAAWINDESRAFPVKIDPSINYDTGIIDTHISSQQPNTSFGNYEDMAIHPFHNSYAYIKIDLPTLPAGADVISANLHTDFYYEGTLGSWVMLGSYKVTSAWTENMTWNTHLAGEGTIDTSDYVELVNVTNFSGMSDYWNGTALWNITNVLEGWYQNPNTNHGMAFHYEYDDPYTVYIKSSEAAFGCPYMTVQYSYLADGVYAITSAAYIRWMTVENDSTEAGATLQQTNVGEGPVASFDRSSLFKISYRASTDSYIIRSMLNNNLGLGYSNDMTKVITKTIPSIDAQVPDFDTFHIEWNEEGNGFVIYRHLSSYVIHLSAPATANLTTVSKNSATATSLWHFGKYTGEEKAGFSVNFGTLIAGESYTKKVAFWSTDKNIYTPQVYIPSDQANIASSGWDGTNHLLTVHAHDNGSATIECRLYLGNNEDFEHEDSYDITVALPLEDGYVYTLKNVASNKLLKPNSNNSGAFIVTSLYNSTATSVMWKLEHVTDGYYKLVNDVTGYYLCAPEHNNENTQITQSFYSSTYGLWKFIEQSDGNYKIQSKNQYERTTDAPLYLTEQNGNVVQNSSSSSNVWDLNVLTLNLNAYYDQAFVDQYSAEGLTAEEAINKIFDYNSNNQSNAPYRNVAMLFKEEFGIKVNFEIVDGVYQSYPYVQDCLHKNNPAAPCNNCKNETIVNGTEFDECKAGYHHKDSMRFIQSTPSSNSAINIMFTGHQATCGSRNGEHDIDYATTCGEAEAIGSGNRIAVYLQTFNLLLMLNDYDRIRETTVHEILHLFGAEHHFGKNDTTCILGYPDGGYNVSYSVHLNFCEDCISKVNLNKLESLYFHNP